MPDRVHASRPAPGIEIVQSRNVTIARVGDRFVSSAELLAAVKREQQRRRQQ